MNLLRIYLVFIGVACLLLGCSNSENQNGPVLYDVTGEVFVNGKLLANGAITLEPADGKGGVYGEQIQAGHFLVKASAGEKRVSITASRPSDELGPDGKPMDEQFIPARYNAKTKLSAEVSPNEKNIFEFKIDADQ